MKKIVTIILVIFCVTNLYAQSRVTDSLKLLLSKEKTDTGKIRLLIRLGASFGFGGSVNDTLSFAFLQQALDLSRNINYEKGIVGARQAITYTLLGTGNYPQALEIAFENMKLAEKIRDSNNLFYQTRAIVWIYENLGNYKSAFTYVKKLASLANSGSFREPIIMARMRAMVDQNLGVIFFAQNEFDSALHYQRLVYDYSLKNNDLQMAGLAAFYLGNTYAKIGNSDSAFLFYRDAIPYTIESKRPDYTGRVKLSMADLFNKTGQPDSAFYYAHASLDVVQNTYAADVNLSADSLLSRLYLARYQYDSAYKYLNNFVILNEKLNNQSKITQAQNLSFAETLHKQQLEQTKKETQQKYETRIKYYILFTIILIFLVIAFLLFRNNRNKQKANIHLNKQKEEIESTLSTLKSTQQQLIQSEKMASLGELTAGIAHEIQNPLNFVNNFSDVSKELLDEMKEAMDKGDTEDAKDIMRDVIDNLEKINHHGKRADAIVKGMLQHSRSSSGQKELTDINALCDEYLRLSYHGLRAKDKSFNAKFETEFDPSLPKISVVPQEMGRVILNLINNAFYATNERKKLSEPGYEPTVTVSTKYSLSSGEGRGEAIITVKDNGTGIPEKIKDKIFQPFFTTKPTGIGTGLGLSLAYDIVKAHGGELKVKTVEGKGSELVIMLPIG